MTTMTMTAKHDLALTQEQHQAIATVYNIIRDLAANEKDIISTTSCRSLSINDLFATLDVLQAVQHNNKWAEDE